MMRIRDCRSSCWHRAPSERFVPMSATADKSRYLAWIALTCPATRTIAPAPPREAALHPTRQNRREADWEKTAARESLGHPARGTVRLAGDVRVRWPFATHFASSADRCKTPAPFGNRG